MSDAGNGATPLLFGEHQSAKFAQHSRDSVVAVHRGRATSKHHSQRRAIVVPVVGIPQLKIAQLDVLHARDMTQENVKTKVAKKLDAT